MMKRKDYNFWDDIAKDSKRMVRIKKKKRMVRIKKKYRNHKFTHDELFGYDN